MQRPDDQKRLEILKVAADLFAARPFHEVRLEDVAAAAHIGKGTIYTYFHSKEELYLFIVHEGLIRLLDELGQGTVTSDSPAPAALRETVRAITAFALRHPELARLMRSGQMPPVTPEHEARRGDLLQAIAGILRRGTERGELADARPEWTAQLIMGAIGEIFVFAAGPLDPEQLADHIVDVVLRGLLPRA